MGDKADTKRLIARLVMRWLEIKHDLDEDEVEGSILALTEGLGESVKVGDVTAEYSNGRTVYDYQGPSQLADPAIIQRNTAPQPDKVDWKKVCEEAGIQPGIAREPVPSVSIKLDKD